MIVFDTKLNLERHVIKNDLNGYFITGLSLIYGLITFTKKVITNEFSLYTFSFLVCLGKASSGNGKIIVEFFSAAILDNVWYNLNLMADGD